MRSSGGTFRPRSSRSSAARVFRADLERFPENVRSLRGLEQAEGR